MNIIQSAFGHYEATGNPADAQLVSGHSFGTETGEHSVNRALAEKIATWADGRLIAVDETLAKAFTRDMPKIHTVIEGDITDTRGNGLGTWGTLERTKQVMDGKGMETALLVAQAHHVGRVAMQAHKLGIQTVIPEGLPRKFEPTSEQWWTRSGALWVPREIAGWYLKLRFQKPSDDQRTGTGG